MDQLTIHEKVGANYLLLELSGEINAYTVAELREKIDSYILDSNVVLDMEHVSSLDSSGIGTVLAGHNDGEDAGTKLFIMNPSSEARYALSKTGFYDAFHVIHSVTEVANVS